MSLSFIDNPYHSSHPTFHPGSEPMFIIDTWPNVYPSLNYLFSMLMDLDVVLARVLFLRKCGWEGDAEGGKRKHFYSSRSTNLEKLANCHAWRSLFAIPLHWTNYPDFLTKYNHFYNITIFQRSCVKWFQWGLVTSWYLSCGHLCYFCSLMSKSGSLFLNITWESCYYIFVCSIYSILFNFLCS